MTLEICSNSLQSAINAQKGGAKRIELCCNLEQGGLTPSAATIQLVRANLDIEVFVLIRPRVGGFCYSDLDLALMKKNIQFCLANGIDGVVFGVLDSHDEIDRNQNRILLEAAGSMQTTFHRAFDCLKEPKKGLADIIELGFNRILTSGLAVTALEGQNLLKELIEKAKTEINILPGSGLNSKNLKEFIHYTKAKEIHASAKKTILPKNNHLFASPYFETDVEEVRRLRAILEQFT